MTTAGIADMSSWGRLTEAQGIMHWAATENPVYEVGYIPKPRGLSDLYTLEVCRYSGDAAVYEFYTEPMSASEFKAAFQAAVPYLNVSKFAEWKVAAAGGAVSQLLQGRPLETNQDIDLFIVTEGKDFTRADLQALIANIYTSLKMARSDIKIVRTGSFITFYVSDSEAPIQLVLRTEATVADLITRFDLAPCQVAFDGTKVYGSALGLLANTYGVMPLNLNQWSPRYNERLVKYMRRGFKLLLPDGLTSGDTRFGPLLFGEAAVQTADGVHFVVHDIEIAASASNTKLGYFEEEEPDTGYCGTNRAACDDVVVPVSAGVSAGASASTWDAHEAPLPDVLTSSISAWVHIRTLAAKFLKHNSISVSEAAKLCDAEEIKRHNTRVFWTLPSHLHAKYMVSYTVGTGTGLINSTQVAIAPIHMLMEGPDFAEAKLAFLLDVMKANKHGIVTTAISGTIRQCVEWTQPTAGTEWTRTAISLREWMLQ
jgi:hypothetical protein